jgi:TetR/AcrR family transcriptional regulator, transcriptional repressor for nem operon
MIYFYIPNGQYMNETKLQIMHVAFKLFLQKGFKEVTMNEILENSGLSRGTFYYYFKSKEQVYADVIEMFFITIPTTAQRKIDDSSLYAFYHDYLANATQTYAQLGKIVKDAQVHIFNYYTLSLDAMKRLPDFKAKTKVISSTIINIWIHIIKRAREQGEIDSIMTDAQIAYFFKFTMEGMGMKSELEGKSSSENDQELIALWDNFYEQIRTKPK